MGYDGTGSNHGTLANMHAFNYYGIGTNQNVVVDPDWFSRRWFDYPGQNRASADMTVLADDCPAA